MPVSSYKIAWIKLKCVRTCIFSDFHVSSDNDCTASMEETLVPFLMGMKFCVKYFPDEIAPRSMIESAGGTVIDSAEDADHIIVPLIHTKFRDIHQKEVGG